VSEQPNPSSTPKPAQPEPDTIGPASRRRRGSAATVAAVVAAVLLIVGGGVGLAAYRALAGGGTQPEKYAPASSFAFAKIDLDPAAAQKLAIRRFADKFPSSPTRKGSGNLRDDFVRKVFEGNGKVNYDRDIKPWLGDRAGVAGFLMGRKPTAELILQYKDKEQARRGLDKLAAEGGKLHYSLQDDYAVLAESQSVVDEAVRQAAKSDLGGVSTYSKDVGELTGSQVMTAWVDIERAVAAARQNRAGGDRVPADLVNQAKGRLVIGVHAGDDYLEFEGATFDAPTTAASGAATDMIRGLPDGTLAALSIGDPGKAVMAAFDGFRDTPGFSQIAPNLNAIQQETGLKLPDDLATLLGRSAVVALGSVPSGGAGMPDVGLRSRPTDPGAGRKIAEQIAALARSSGGGVTVETQQAGDDVILAVGNGYAGRLAAGGKLGGSKLFRTAMGDLPDKVSLATFVDLGALLRNVSRDTEDARHLRAVGMSVRQDGKTQRLRIRIVAG